MCCNMFWYEIIRYCCWVTQKTMAQIFDTSRENITTHIRNILKTKELLENSVSKIILHTASDGKKYSTKWGGKKY